MRHILIAEKDGDKVDFAASKAKADEIYAQLEGGADFAALAKESSADPGARTRAASSRSRAARPFPSSTRSRSSSTRASSRSPSRPSTATTSSRRSPTSGRRRRRRSTRSGPTIRATLLQEKRNEEMQAWVEDLKKDYEGKVSYAAGYEPPELPGGPDRDPVGSRAMSLAEALLDLQELTRQLRRECPWDREQTRGHDRPAHGRGGVRGRRRRAGGRRRGAPRRARRSPLPGLLPVAAPRGARAGRPRVGRPRGAREARPAASARLR